VPPGGGTPRCQSAQDTSTGCDTCTANAYSGGGTGIPCMPANDPDCGDCAPQMQACLNDM
jgi:hypothetical protein